LSNAEIFQIGKHRVRHGNVMDGIADLMGPEKADVFYSDPPWGQGNLNYWQTQNNKMNGAPKEEINLPAFLHQIFGLAETYAKNLVFIEYGKKWMEEVIAMAASHNLRHLGTAEPLYRSGEGLLPLHLHVFAKRPVSEVNATYLRGITGTHGYKTLQAAVTPLVGIPGAYGRGGLYLDPCCGLGLGARIAIENQMMFRGNELNRKRLGETMKRLQRDVARS
jgi:hypothetical protein